MSSPSPAYGSRSWRWPLRALSAVLVAGGWDLLARQLESLLFPTPGETLAAMGRLALTADFWRALWISHQALLAGFAAAAVGGIALGLVMGRWRTADAFADPYLSILFSTPMAALIPVVIITFGLGLLSRTLVVFLFAVVVVAVSTRTGLRTLDPTWIEMARTLGATERQVWQSVLLPGAVPAIMSGLHLGLARALTGMIAVELMMIAVGVGRLIVDFQGAFDAGAVYATVLVIVAEAVVVLGVLRRVERRLAPWSGQAVIE